MTRKEAEKIVHFLREFIEAAIEHRVNGDLHTGLNKNQAEEELVQALEIYIENGEK